MHQHQAGAVAVNEPDAVHLVPRTFMREEQQRGIGRGELQMIQPVMAAVEGFHLAGRQIAAEQFHFGVLVKAFLNVLRLALAFGVQIGSCLLARLLALDGFGIQRGGAGDDRFIAIHRHGMGTAWQRGDPFYGLGGEIGGKYIGALIVINLPGLAAHLQHAQPFAGHHLGDLMRREVEGINARRRGERHLGAVRSERVDVEIKTFAARLGRQPHDAVPRIGINPFARRFVGVGLRPAAQRGGAAQDGKGGFGKSHIGSGNFGTRIS